MSQSTHSAHAEPAGTAEPLIAPPFAALDVEGRRVALADFRGRQSVVLVFNRGFR